jgi:hypothetical protein
MAVFLQTLKNSIRNILVLFLLLFAGVTSASAQSVGFSFGLGTATNSANGQPLDSFGDVGPKLGGVFATFAGDYMFRPSLGFGAEYSFRASQGNYAPQVGVNYRPIFYDFNAIWHPVTTSTRVVPEFQGGLGGADLKFYESQTECAIVGVCTTLNQYIASSNHFQLHFSGGVRLYVKPSIYIRPQVDVHWVNNFQEFGSSWVPEYSVAIGYSFGSTH